MNRTGGVGNVEQNSTGGHAVGNTANVTGIIFTGNDTMSGSCLIIYREIIYHYR